jgi:hypothetical protein
VIDYLQKNLPTEEISVLQGVRLLGRPFCEQVDNPRANIEICVISDAGTKFLSESELDRVVSSIEKDIAEEQNPTA